MVIRLAEFLSQCPALEGERVCVNYLDGDVGAVSLTPGTKVENKPYADGGRLSTQQFVLAVRTEYGKAHGVMKRIAEQLSGIEDWIFEQNENGNYPDFDDRVTVVSCNIVRGFAPELTGSVDARYEAEIELVFYKD